MKFVGATQNIVCSAAAPKALDTDEDGVADCIDNCPDVANPDQADGNGNGIGDACEDTTPPATQINIDGERCPDSKTTSIGAVNINITACDDGDSCRVAARSAMNTKGTSLLSMIKDAIIGKTYAQVPQYQLPQGIAAIYYNINNGNRKTYSGTFTLDQPGSYVIKAYAIDNAGNTGAIVSQTIIVGPSGACTSSANSCGKTATGTYVCATGGVTCSATTPPNTLCDTTPPVTTATLSGKIDGCTTGAYVGTVNVKLTATDNMTGTIQTYGCMTT
jgi:hypothetical protein